MSLFPNFDRWKREYKKAIEEWQKSQKQKGNSRPPVNLGGPAAANNLVRKILGGLGPLGQIVGAMLRPNGQRLAPDVAKELEAAQTLLSALGASEKSEPKRELVEERKPVRMSSNPPPDKPGVRGPAQDSPDEGESGPLFEGMIPVRSSNVHSIGYEWNPQDARKPGSLLVRFLGGSSKHRAGPGALYRYFDVPRSVFVAFKRAASAGKFVWSNLRIRGTVSGHQYDYALAGTGTDGYIPRQAGLKRGQQGEYFLNRSYKGRGSNLPERKVRKGPAKPLTPNFQHKARSITFRR